MILRRLLAALRTARETLRLSPWPSRVLNPTPGHLSQRQTKRRRSQLFLSVRCTTTRSLVLVTCICAFAPMTVLAWLYPEHRSITFLAIEMLEPEQRSQLDALWSEARRGHESRLCAQMADSAQGLNPGCIDYAAWPALAGDHSCSPQETVHEIGRAHV